MSVGVSLSPRSDLRTQLLLKIPSCGGPPKTLFLKFCSFMSVDVSLSPQSDQVHALKTKKVAAIRGGPTVSNDKISNSN
ncbi:unnamed protein product, partial [Vitis vinifera]|uniref:Uncharacterized protein n=1 Tax=Vitis vinifera TaxID=29760 RepID=D7TSH5_VITVI